MAQVGIVIATQPNRAAFLLSLENPGTSLKALWSAEPSELENAGSASRSFHVGGDEIRSIFMRYDLVHFAVPGNQLV